MTWALFAFCSLAHLTEYLGTSLYIFEDIKTKTIKKSSHQSLDDGMIWKNGNKTVSCANSSDFNGSSYGNSLTLDFKDNSSEVNPRATMTYEGQYLSITRKCS